MNDLCADIGYKSINHVGEELCGDHVDIVEENESSTVIVLADGLGSGVKASILSTLTSKIISTMMAAGLPIEECVSTIAGALPVCSVRGVAYSTFTIVQIYYDGAAYIAEFDNPACVVMRGNKVIHNERQCEELNGRKIYITNMLVEPGDHQSGSKNYRSVSRYMGKENPYFPAFDTATKCIARDEANGCDPDKLGRKIARTLKKKHLPRRLRVASLDQHLAVMLHDVLPARLFDWIIGSYYQKK